MLDISRKNLACLKSPRALRALRLGPGTLHSVQVGNQKALERLGGWKGVEEWESSRRGVWLSDGKGDDDGGHRRPIGYAKVGGREQERGPPVLCVVLTPWKGCTSPGVL